MIRAGYSRQESLSTCHVEMIALGDNLVKSSERTHPSDVKIYDAKSKILI